MDYTVKDFQVYLNDVYCHHGIYTSLFMKLVE